MVVVLGSWFLSLMITIFLVLLYFNEKKAAFLLTGVYALLSVSLTFLFMNFFNQYGGGMFIAALISLIFGSRLLVSRLNDLDYTTFCYQPIVQKTFITKTEWLLKKIGSLD